MLDGTPVATQAAGLLLSPADRSHWQQQGRIQYQMEDGLQYHQGQALAGAYNLQAPMQGRCFRCNFLPLFYLSFFPSFFLFSFLSSLILLHCFEIITRSQKIQYWP
jgi:hypothetical protein